MRIAYVEDNPTNLALVERIARMTQHQVVSYTEGEIALQELQHEKYDLILMDIELAGTVSGLEVVRVLREYGLKTPIIAVTAYAMMGDRDKCLAAGCDDYLPKPLPITEFLAMLAKYDVLLQAPAQASAQPTVAPAPVTAPPLVSRAETHPSKPTGVLPPLPTVQPAAPAVPAVTPPVPPTPAPASVQPAAPAVPAAPPPVPPTPAPASVQSTAPAVPAATSPVPPAPAPASVQPAAPAVPATPPPVPPTPAPASVQSAAPAAPPPAPVVVQPAGMPPAARETTDNGQRPTGTQEAPTSGSVTNAQPPAAPKEIRMPAHPVDPDEKRTI